MEGEDRYKKRERDYLFDDEVLDPVISPVRSHFKKSKHDDDSDVKFLEKDVVDEERTDNIIPRRRNDVTTEYPKIQINNETKNKEGKSYIKVISGATILGFGLFGVYSVATWIGDVISGFIDNKTPVDHDPIEEEHGFIENDDKTDEKEIEEEEDIVNIKNDIRNNVVEKNDKGYIVISKGMIDK